MTVSKMLLEILVCPENRLPVKPAEAALLERINGAIAAGVLVNRGGERVTEKIEEGLVREDGKVLYPVREDIPVMLIEEGIDLTQEALYRG